MADFARDGLNLNDEDRLPWLEPAEDFEDEGGISPLRLLGFILGGLLLIGLIVGGIALIRGAVAGGEGDGKLIAAPKDSYKIAAHEADAKKFAGEGDASFAASEGVQREGRIDPSRLPEAPVTSAPTSDGQGKLSSTPGSASSAKPEPRVVAKVADATAHPSATVAGTAKPTGAGAMVQLGAYGSSAVAKDAWSKLSRRFNYLADLPMSVQDVKVGDATLYRLRAVAGSGANAAALCGRLKVAGENCMVVN